MPSLCVFCGASSGFDGKYLQLVKQLAKVMVDRKWDLVYGGASVGLMGALADEVLRLGGLVYGVIPQGLMNRELAHKHLTELFITDSMHSRKAQMYNLSDAFLAIAGGIGTLDELFEIYTWIQLKSLEKPVAVLNSFGFYDMLLSHLKLIRREGFLTPEGFDILKVYSEVEEMGAELLGSQGHDAPPLPLC